MNATSRSRVLVWLDPVSLQQASLEVLSGLGPTTEILGLFVEDTNLLDLSRLNVAREITFEGANAPISERQSMEKQFRVHGARMRSVFESAAKQSGSSCSFLVARGDLRAELLSHSAGFDVLVLAHSRMKFGPRVALRAQLHELLSAGPRTIVFVQEQWRTGQRVATVFDGSVQSEAALRIAWAMARSEGQGLSVWFPRVPEDDFEQLRAAVAKLLGTEAIYSIRQLDIEDVRELARAAAAENPRVLVLPGKEPGETRQLVTDLLDEVNCSLIVAR